MERAQRIAIAKQLLEMIDRNETEYGDEPAWEADIGRFTDKERFLKEKEEFLLNMILLQALGWDRSLKNSQRKQESVPGGLMQYLVACLLIRYHQAMIQQV